MREPLLLQQTAQQCARAQQCSSELTTCVPVSRRSRLKAGAEVLAQATARLLLVQSAWTTMQPLYDYDVFKYCAFKLCMFALCWTFALLLCVWNYSQRASLQGQQTFMQQISVVVVDLSNAHIHIRRAHPVRYHLASMRSISFLVVSLTVSPNCSSYCSLSVLSLSWRIDKPKRTCIRSRQGLSNSEILNVAGIHLRSAADAERCD
eukprot:12731-Heterococcus_DN1.PRE.2